MGLDYEKFKEDLKIEELKAENFKGWDFSYLGDRLSFENLSWNYKKIVQDYLGYEDVVLDMGTGGGKHILSFKHPYHLTCVTEGNDEDYELCLKELKPLGISVKKMSSGNIPFEDNKFDIIINYHEYFDIWEVQRVLKPGGIFITQQIGSDDSYELIKTFIPEYKKPFSNNSIVKNINDMRTLNLKILFAREEFPKIYFYDVGAFVYFAKIAIWQLTDFSVDKYFEQLYEMQKQIDEKNFIENQEHRFIIVVQNHYY